MIEKVHEHILDELRINAKSDTLFILAAIGLNLLILAINSSIANSNLKSIFSMIIFASFGVFISIIAEIGLYKGRQASRKLIEGLIKMYEENNVAQYYDISLLDHYKLRYNLFILAIILTGIISIIIPFVNIG